jgi:hypothetical protein
MLTILTIIVGFGTLWLVGKGLEKAGDAMVKWGERNRG